MNDETVGFKFRFEGVYRPALACSLRLTSEWSESYDLAAKQKKEEEERKKKEEKRKRKKKRGEKKKDDEKKKKKKRCSVPIKT